MMDGRHFENCWMRYLTNRLIDFGDICMAMHINSPNLTVDQKFKNFKIQDRGRRPSWKSKNGDISKTVLADYDEIFHDDTY